MTTKYKYEDNITLLYKKDFNKITLSTYNFTSEFTKELNL